MRNKLIGFAILAAIILATGLIFGSHSPRTPSIPAPLAAPITIQGTFACLPHKASSGPQTMECAFGVQTVDGSFLALDSSLLGTGFPDLAMNRPFSITGILVPLEDIPQGQWDKYNIKGILRVQKYSEIDGGPIDLALRESRTVNGTRIQVWAVTQDSRCPQDVQCIQAGKAVIALRITTPKGPTTISLEEGKTLATENLAITLDKVLPYPISTHSTGDAEYHFILSIKNPLTQ